MVSDFSELCVGGGAGEGTGRGGNPSFKQGQSITTFRIPKYKFWSWDSSDSGPPYFYCGKGGSYILISDKFKRSVFATVYTEEIQGLQLWKGVDKSLIVLHERPKTEVLFLVPHTSAQYFWFRFPPVEDDFKLKPESAK